MADLMQAVRNRSIQKEARAGNPSVVEKFEQQYTSPTNGYSIRNSGMTLHRSCMLHTFYIE